MGFWYWATLVAVIILGIVCFADLAESGRMKNENDRLRRVNKDQKAMIDQLQQEIVAMEFSKEEA